MPWGVVAAAVIGGVASYASAQSAEGASEEAQQAELEAQKQLQANKRKYELEDRKYRQDAVGGWGKYLDPKLAPQGSGGTAPAKIGDNADHSAVDDPNNPAYARNPVAAGTNALPINHPAAFQGMRPQNGMAPQSLWFARQYPDYDPNAPTG
jgi:hypothetical protein